MSSVFASPDKAKAQNKGSSMGVAPGTRYKQGPVTLNSGAIYTGEWENGMRNGYGSQEWPDGS